MDIDQLTIPQIEHTSVITVNSDQFSRYCRDLAQLSDSVTVSTKSEEVFMKVDGSAGFGFIKLTNANDTGKKEDQTTIEVVQPVTQQFALNYLNLFNRASTLSVFTRLMLHQEQPLVIEFRIDGLGVLKYYLAPKVNE